MANRAQPFNARALQMMGVPPLESGIDGRGVVIGFVDYGFDILHPCVRNPATGGTRFRYLWDQNSGREFDARAIDRLVELSETSGSRQPADAVYDPHANYFGRSGIGAGAHGTAISSIAAGSPVAGFRGVAPAADLIGVQLGLLDHHWKEEDAKGVPSWTGWAPLSEPVWNGWRSYDEAPEIISALEYICDRATRLQAKALVINLSIGAYAGAHDGQSPVERAITAIVQRSLVAKCPPCAVVVAAGNAGLDDGHFAGTATPGRPLAFAWRMNRDDLTHNKLEIWYRSASPPGVSIALQDNVGAAPLEITPGLTHVIAAAGVRIGIAEHVQHARGALSRIRILVHPPSIPRHLWPEHSGELSLDIHCTAPDDESVPLHAWIERDEGLANRSSLYPSTPCATLTNIAAAEGALVVAGFDHHQRGDDPAVFPPSSAGPLPWQEAGARPAPLVAAPAHRVWSARSKSGGFTEISGTSAAAALASGAVALLMQRILGTRRSFDPHRLAERLVASHRGWNPRFGYGPVNIAHVFEEVTA